MSIPELSRSTPHISLPQIDEPEETLPADPTPEPTISQSIPQIENRDALALSQRHSSAGFYLLFNEIRTALKNTTTSSLLELGESIFAKNIEDFEYLHETPLRDIQKQFVVYFDRHLISRGKQQIILTILSVVFYTSVQNSSFGQSAKTLNKFIESYIPKTEKRHFQNIIKKAKDALETSNKSSHESEALKKLQSAIVEVDSLLKLYIYIEGRNGALIKDLIFFETERYGVSFPFPFARSEYDRFKKNLNDRKQDSPLKELSKQLRDKIKQLLKKESQLPPKEQERVNFCNIERDAIWTASINLLAAGYTNSHPNETTPPEESLYRLWLEKSDTAPEAILERFISQMDSDTFDSLSKKVQKHHPAKGDDTVSFKNERAQILVSEFLGSFQIPSRFEPSLQTTRPLNLHTLKKWCEK